MVRDCAGHTWTYDPAHRRWYVDGTRLVVYVGGKGSDGHTATWLDGGGTEYPGLGMAMSEEADHDRRSKAYVGAIINNDVSIQDHLDRVSGENHGLRLRLSRVVLANRVIGYFLFVAVVGGVIGWLQ